MNVTLKFQVTVEKSDKEWLVSKVFDNYEDAQKWRYQQEAQLLKADPSRKNVRSNLLFIRDGVQ